MGVSTLVEKDNLIPCPGSQRRGTTTSYLTDHSDDLRYSTSREGGVKGRTASINTPVMPTGRRPPPLAYLFLF